MWQIQCWKAVELHPDLQADRETTGFNMGFGNLKAPPVTYFLQVTP